MPPKKGIFITLEGGEGAGKSTQIKLLQQALSESGIDVVATREPGGTPQAERIRDLLVQGSSGVFDPLTEALLLFAARREHLVHKILPALEKGQWVICDRFADSTRAMQGYGLGLDKSFIEALYRMVAGDLNPDLTFIFDIDPVEGLQRSSKRLQQLSSGEDRYERMELPFHQRLHDGFLEIAKGNPDRCAVIDAMQDVDSVHAEVMKIVAARYPLNFKGARHG
jgi:dTMP kinase